MDVGMGTIFENDDYLASETDAPFGIRDLDVYRRDLKLACAAESLGFDSIWGLEHHFTGYAMIPDVMQFLAYMAAKTTHVRLGTMVLVLPWNNPVRTAESIAMLDNLSDGRFVLGMGRGLGRIEFDGLGVPMAESRTRFIESAEMIIGGLERGYVKYDGEHFHQPERWLRPAPTRSFRGRTYASAVSPESLRIMATLGVGLLIVPQKPWDTIIAEVAEYRGIFEEINGTAAPEPIIVNQVFCDRDPGRARELGERYIADYFANVTKHYELEGGHFKQTKGYEYYEKSAEQMKKNSRESSQHFYADLQCYGTPNECVDRVAYIKEHVGCSEFIGLFSFSGMSGEEAQRNMELFAGDVMPRLKEFGLRSQTAPKASLEFPAAF